MIIMSLDESAGFANTNSPAFIGGILYDDHGIQEEGERERARIKWYYKQLFEKSGGKNADQRYPKGLHSGQGADELVPGVKAEVVKTLPEFLKKGTCYGKEFSSTLFGNTIKESKREGEYYIWLVLKSEGGMQDENKTKQQFLLREEEGDNLYYHMADEVLEHIIFHNPVLGKIERLHPYIATRSSGWISHHDAAYKTYSRLGYRRNQPQKQGNNEVKTQFSFMNGDVYRTLFTQKMMYTPCYPQIKEGEFNICSINYNNEKANMEYLYLADSICSYLGDTHPVHGTVRQHESSQWIGEINTLANDMVVGEDHVLLFAYDRIDILFSNAWKAYEKGDYHTALTISYKAKEQKGAFARYYQNKWFLLLENKMKQADDLNAWKQTISHIKSNIFSNELEQKRELFIYHFIEQVMQKYTTEECSDEKRRLLYWFYNLGISLYSHVGDTKKAWECYEKCQDYFGAVSTEDILRCKNQSVVILTDSFQWEKAREQAEQVLNGYISLKEVRYEIACTSPNKSYLPHQKAKSQMAQVLSLYRNAKAETYYLSALEGMQGNIADYNITLSYLLHFYMDMGWQEKYELWATKYFGNYDKPLARLEYLISHSFCENAAYHFTFGFYVFVRGLYLFEKDQIEDDLWEILADIVTYIKENGKNNPYVERWDTLKGHPSYLICKYMRLLAKERSDEQAEKLYRKYDKESHKGHEKIVSAIEIFGEAEICHITNDTKSRDAYIDQLEAYLKNPDHYFISIAEAGDIPTDPERKYQYFANKFTFMYH